MTFNISNFEACLTFHFDKHFYLILCVVRRLYFLVEVFADGLISG